MVVCVCGVGSSVGLHSVPWKSNKPNPYENFGARPGEFWKIFANDGQSHLHSLTASSFSLSQHTMPLSVAWHGTPEIVAYSPRQHSSEASTPPTVSCGKEGKRPKGTPPL